jgi:hypothetical protein
MAAISVPRVRVSWDEGVAPGHGYGFPVAKNIRDLLIGDDKTFF